MKALLALIPLALGAGLGYVWMNQTWPVAYLIVAFPVVMLTGIIVAGALVKGR